MEEKHPRVHIENVLSEARAALEREDWRRVRKNALLVLNQQSENIEARRLFYLAWHHPNPACRPQLNELETLGVPEEYDPTPADPTKPTSENRHDGYVPRYGPWDDRPAAWLRGIYQWDVFIGYANVEPDASVARRMAQYLVDTGFLHGGTMKCARVFFAPYSVRANAEQLETAWSFELKRAVLSSYSYIGLVSEAFIRSAYCELECQAFQRIVAVNPTRTLTLVAARETQIDDLTLWRPDLLAYRASKPSDTLMQAIDGVGEHLGEPFEPRDVFQRLPLDQVPTKWRLWIEANHDPVDPPYEIFEDFVRDIMVRIQKGLDSNAPAPSIFSGLWTPEHIDAVIESARWLLAHGVSPLV